MTPDESTTRHENEKDDHILHGSDFRTDTAIILQSPFQKAVQKFAADQLNNGVGDAITRQNLDGGQAAALVISRLKKEYRTSEARLVINAAVEDHYRTHRNEPREETTARISSKHDRFRLAVIHVLQDFTPEARRQDRTLLSHHILEAMLGQGILTKNPNFTEKHREQAHAQILATLNQLDREGKLLSYMMTDTKTGKRTGQVGSSLEDLLATKKITSIDISRNEIMTEVIILAWRLPQLLSQVELKPATDELRKELARRLPEGTWNIRPKPAPADSAAGEPEKTNAEWMEKRKSELNEKKKVNSANSPDAQRKGKTDAHPLDVDAVLHQVREQALQRRNTPAQPASGGLRRLLGKIFG